MGGWMDVETICLKALSCLHDPKHDMGHRSWLLDHLCSLAGAGGTVADALTVIKSAGHWDAQPLT